jgi:hypothetical protein
MTRRALLVVACVVAALVGPKRASSTSSSDPAPIVDQVASDRADG